MTRVMLFIFLTAGLAACMGQVSEEDLLDRARVAIDQGDVRAAEIDVKTVLQENPDNMPARRLLGEIYVFQRNPALAVEEFERALAVEENEEVRVLYARALLTAGLGQRLLELDGQDRFASVAEHPRYLAALARALAADGDLRQAASIMDTALAAAPDDPNVTTDNAFLLLSYSNDLEGARVLLQDTLSLHPEYVDAQSLLGGIQQMEGELALAESSFARVAELNPYRIVDRLNLITVQLNQGITEAAESGLQRLLASHPNHPGANFIEGRMLVEAGDNSAALTAFFKVLNVLPEHQGALYLSAVANIREGNHATALGQLDALLVQEPDHLEGRLLLSNLHLRMADPAAAEEVASAILQDDETHYTAMRLLEAARNAREMPVEPVTLARMARSELLSGQPAEAEGHLRQALVIQPDDLAMRRLLIDALMGQGKRDEASAMLADLPEDVTREPAAQVAMGRLALAGGRPVEAEEHLQNAMAADPGTLTLLWLSGAISAQGRSEEAISLLNDWLGEHPEDVLVRNQLASSYLRLEREGEAREEYQRVVELLPDNVLVLNNLAWLLRKDDPRQALMYIERADELAPDNPQIMDTYAMIQLELGAGEEAQSLSRRALDGMPDDPTIRYHRAVVLKADGQREEAIRILEAMMDTADMAPPEEARALLAELRGL